MKPIPTLGIALMLAGSPGTVLAASLHVPGDAPTIAAALAAAQAGDEIVIACGTYHEHGLDLVGGVTIRSENGDPGCVMIDGDAAGAVLLLHVESLRSVIEGLTITGGRADQGGAARIEYADVLFRRCRLTGNQARFDGPAIYALRSSVQVEHCLIARNHDYEPAWGGATSAIVAADSDLVIRNSTIAANTFVPRPPELHAAGGGEVRRSTVLVDRSIIAMNDGIQIAWSFSTWTGVFAMYDDPLFCDITADFRLDSASPCLPGGMCPELVGALGHGCGPVVPLSYTVTSEPPGLPFLLDGVGVTTPVVRTWDQYSEHEVVAATAIGTAPGARVTFLDWSDGGEAAHVLIAPRASGTFTARYRTEYELAMPVIGSGTVSPGTAWHLAGSVVTIDATPLPGRFLHSWTGSGAGSYTGAANPATVTMLGPVSELARFELIPFEFSLSGSATDPHANRAPATGGVRPLYLWLTCAGNGLSAMEAGMTGTMPVLGFEPLNGVLNAGTATDLLLAVPDCPRGDDVDLLLGVFHVAEPPGGGRLCLGSAGGSGTEEFAIVGAVDCDLVRPFYSRAPGVTGFASDGSAPCRKGRQTCSPVAIAEPGLPAGAPEEAVAAPGPRVFPNPFATSIDVSFALSRDGRAGVRIYDVGGRLVRIVLDESRSAGGHRVTWDGRNAEGREAPAGIYFARILTGDAVRSLKILRLAR